MKTKYAITSIALVVAASLSMSTMAGNNNHNPKKPTPEPSASTAVIADAQVSLFNDVENMGTENNAHVNEVLNGGNGNAGVNVAAGDTNQQANALAISTADADAGFVFGHSASASVLVGQLNAGNNLINNDVTNNAGADRIGNGFNGNLGLNVTAGAFNQQKNDAAIANSAEAQNATASVAVLQVAVKSDTYNGVGEDGLAYVKTGYGYGGHHGGGWGNPTQNLDVSNNASLSNSLNNFSGNAGVNIAAGGTNQQSNSLSIAAGCNACP